MTEIFGHRGSAGTHPENTMISFEHAIKVGAHGIELDVQFTKDQTIVIIHDETVDRTTDGKGFVKDYTYKQLRKLDASYKFKNKYGTCHIPTLEELLNLCTHNNVMINIEFKNGIIDYDGLEEKVIDLVDKYKMSHRVIFSSFNHYSIVKCKKLAPQIETSALFMEGLYEPWEYASQIGASAIHPYHLATKPDIIAQSLSAGILIRPFTINKEKQIKNFIDQKCSGIITDYPEKCLKLM